MSILGSLVIKADGFEEEKLIDDVRIKCKVKSLYKQNSSLYIETSFLYAKLLKSLCSEHGFVYETISEKGIAFTIRRYLRRYGMLLGVALAILITFLFSNIAMRIEITGTQDEVLIDKIMQILESEGVSTGVYIPSVNFVKANIRLTSLCDEIAWSSIAHTGSAIKVDVAERTPKENTDSKRIPSNIIASRDGVIVKAEVLCGELEVLVGDAVAKGDLLVNGIVERRNGIAYYYHSFGSIMARFDDNIDISQPYKISIKYYGDTHYKRSIRIFDADFSIPNIKTRRGNYEVDSDTSYLYFFGIKLPFGITTEMYTEVTFEDDVLSTEEAFIMAYEKLDNYERNILANAQIVSRSVQEIMNEEGVMLRVGYTLIDEIGVQQEIYAK